MEYATNERAKQMIDEYLAKNPKSTIPVEVTIHNTYSPIVPIICASAACALTFGIFFVKMIKK